MNKKLILIACALFGMQSVLVASWLQNPGLPIPTKAPVSNREPQDLRLDQLAAKTCAELAIKDGITEQDIKNSQTLNNETQDLICAAMPGVRTEIYIKSMRSITLNINFMSALANLHIPSLENDRPIEPLRFLCARVLAHKHDAQIINNFNAPIELIPLIFAAKLNDLENQLNALRHLNPNIKAHRSIAAKIGEIRNLQHNKTFDNAPNCRKRLFGDTGNLPPDEDAALPMPATQLVHNPLLD